MEEGVAGAAAGAGAALSEAEARYFSDLFLCCDEAASGRAPLLKATELFRSANLPPDALKQILEISLSPNNALGLNYMNRKQFYSALRLIAAHQSNVPLKPELLVTPLELPLPRFTWALNSEANADLIQLSNSPKEQHIPKRDRSFTGNLGCYEPMRLSSNLSDSDIPQTSLHDNTEPLSTDSEMESETISQRSDMPHGMRAKNGSPWSTASESPTPTNSVAERQPHPVWENSATGRGVWPANTTEEHTQLLGTEEESSDRHSSEEEGGEGGAGGAWAVSEAQARHYATQFAQLHPDARRLLPGHVARLFFEKSRLSVSDLRKIWQLSDISKDGALSLEEFSIAMHLIVLRRNNIPVPDALPACLVPKVDSRFSQQAVTTDLVDLGSDMFSSGTSADFNLGPKDPPLDHYESKTTSQSPPKAESQNNKEWTKFVDSPTSSVSSPGPKPVNFDFHKSALERDPKIFHPVALRVTPDANSLPQHGDEPRSSSSPRRDDHAQAFDIASPKRLNSQPPMEAPPNGNPEIKPIQRPQAKKPLKPVGVLPPPPTRESSVHADDGPQSLQFAPKKEPPPPPPPRPLRSHARSSSLDLNRFKGPAPPPHPPPRVSPSATSPLARRPLVNQRSEGDTLAPLKEPPFPPQDAFAPPKEEEFANFAHFEGGGLVRSRIEEEPKRHGAFEVYRKPASREPSCEVDPDVRSLQEQNSLLHRVCHALCLELGDVQRERESLKLKLDSNGTAV